MRDRVRQYVRMVTAGGGVALASAGGAAHAATLIDVTAPPSSLYSIYWSGVRDIEIDPAGVGLDVDSDGQIDFTLRHRSFTATSSGDPYRLDVVSGQPGTSSGDRFRRRPASLSSSWSFGATRFVAASGPDTSAGISVGLPPGPASAYVGAADRALFAMAAVPLSSTGGDFRGRWTPTSSGTFFSSPQSASATDPVTNTAAFRFDGPAGNVGVGLMRITVGPPVWNGAGVRFTRAVVRDWVILTDWDQGAAPSLDVSLTAASFPQELGPLGSSEVPEPAPLALLAAGALGVLAMRRRLGGVERRAPQTER